MSQVFISYKREEREVARRLADQIEAAGLSVWWDPQLRGGDHFDDVIEAAIHSAVCVVVLWSAASVKSRYVRDEATLALKLQKLVPAAMDSEIPPFRFQGLHTHVISDFVTSQLSKSCEPLIRDLQERCVPRGDRSTVGAEPPPELARSQHVEAEEKRGFSWSPDLDQWVAVVSPAPIWFKVAAILFGLLITLSIPLIIFILFIETLKDYFIFSLGLILPFMYGLSLVLRELLRLLAKKIWSQ